MSETTYQGWTNQATWGVALIINNDRGLYEESREMCRAASQASLTHDNVPEIWSRGQAWKFLLADALKDWVGDGVEIGERTTKQMRDAGVWTEMVVQLVAIAIGDVDWNEIADSLISESVENERVA